MKRVFWTVGVASTGLLLGLKGLDTLGDIWGAALGLIWGGSIGYGFGSIFDQKGPTKWLVANWAVTLGLVGPFFGLLVGAWMKPFASAAQLTLAGALGSLAGMLLGFLVGKIQLKQLRRRFGSQSSTAV